MRLYLNDKEARLIRATIMVSFINLTKDQQETAHRMDLCDKLQNSERGSKENDR